MKPKTIEPWKVLASREVFSAPPWISVFRETIRLPDGKVIDDYHKIGLLDFVMIVAESPDGNILLERQYKHGPGRVCLTLPAGGIGEGETPLAAAQRELLEETGCASDDWQQLGAFTANASYGCGTMNLFRARGVKKIAEPDSGDLEEMEMVFLPPAELLHAIAAGELTALSSVAAIALALNPDFTRQSGS